MRAFVTGDNNTYFFIGPPNIISLFDFTVCVLYGSSPILIQNGPVNDKLYLLNPRVKQHQIPEDDLYTNWIEGGLFGLCFQL